MIFRRKKKTIPPIRIWVNGKIETIYPRDSVIVNSHGGRPLMDMYYNQRGTLEVTMRTVKIEI